MSKEALIELEGYVEELLPNAMFIVRITDNHKIIAVISGRMRQHRIQILTGDKVRIEMSQYDLSKGRITYREK